MTTHYSVHIEFNSRTVTPEETVRIVDELEEWHAAVGTSPRGWLDVQLTVPAETLEGATRTALSLTAHAIYAKPLAVTTMTEAEFDARLGVPSAMPELVGVTDAAQLLGVSRQRVLQMIDEGKLSSTRIGNVLAVPLSEIAAREPDVQRIIDAKGTPIASAAETVTGVEHVGRSVAKTLRIEARDVNDDITPRSRD